MQSTGQGATHSSQPVHSSVITVCMRLAAPRMASTGQAWMHLVQPMHSASRITAASGDWAGSARGRSGWPVSAASCTRVRSPPGGQRLMGSPSAIASA